MYSIHLPEIGTFDAWRDKARALLAAAVAPEDVLWTCGRDSPDLFQAAGPLPQGDRTATASKAFISMANLAIWHRDPERFSRLYALLFALQSDQRLMSDKADPRVAKLTAMSKEVSRDKHKMTAFLRFREVGDRNAPRRSFAAWFEPTHLICEPIAPFFAKRFGDMDWKIFTPDLSIHFNGNISFAPGQPKPPIADDATEELWRTYYRSIFNPARVKTRAMQSEMPKKYWKNLPEAQLIPEMLAEAQARAQSMADAAPTLAPARAARVSERLRAQQAQHSENADQFTTSIQGCRRCSLWKNATQAVVGTGPLDAEIMIVGEQPGDHEDLAGQPFVGPAGQLLDQGLAGAGIDRSRVYVTNAVKHFKFRANGRQRIHQSPNRTEIENCKWWLDLEIERVAPKLLVALGATALESLTGTRHDLLNCRGSLERTPDGRPVFVTVHPSYILRLPNSERAAALSNFTDDLHKVAALLQPDSPLAAKPGIA
ncbi:UdgX family uracil-DNA binding protein [Tropicibacter naphthalenivorans]|uniref:Type-4 uracil-DNA glycosylase n=1 Tax=Tropicibacter naphthalenivorans TaxID=441103 RepID=A0A0P1GCW8_9RHOB|nr:UdgX family uracil-DNA binding protein [Tropicibacter naphthalenivorans]CUH79147.1 uracil-DNA glycosylase family domain protein [Tropicibacter naphthalenivorans]SMD03264.1 DNA polymerase [Tropicibacter naphthalenivorans]